MKPVLTGFMGRDPNQTSETAQTLLNCRSAVYSSLLRRSPSWFNPLFICPRLAPNPGDWPMLP